MLFMRSSLPHSTSYIKAGKYDCEANQKMNQKFEYMSGNTKARI